MSRTIHIIDDDLDILTILGHFFKKRGYKVIADLTGNKLDTDHDEPADLYLIDIDLGEKSGIDLCQIIKAKNHKTPVILMSANPRLEKLAKESLSDFFISKPFDMERLIFLTDSVTAT